MCIFTQTFGKAIFGRERSTGIVTSTVLVLFDPVRLLHFREHRRILEKVLFESLEDIQSNVTTVLIRLSKNDFQQCVQAQHGL